jgi:hypothetical protein
MPSRPYGRGTFLGFSIMPRVVVDEQHPKVGLYVSSRDVLEKHSLFGGIAGGKDLDLDGLCSMNTKVCCRRCSWSTISSSDMFRRGL